MGEKKRWRTAVTGSLLIHVILFAAAGAFWSWESIRSRQPIYVEVTMADLLAPVDGAAGGGGTPAGASSSAPNQPSPRSSDGFSAVADPRLSSTPAAGGVVGGTGGTVGTGGTGDGTGVQGSGQGTGAGTGSGTGSGPTRGPRIVDGGRPAYPENARNKGWEGTVKLQILVSTEGRVEDVRVVASSGYAELDQAALRAVRAWRFSPALQKGTPVAAWATLPITFDLQ
jgi:periplasmic protein TonB